MLFAARTDTAYGLGMMIVDSEGIGVPGQSPTVRVRDGATSDSYLDFADNTFKSSGWTAQEIALDDMGLGRYEYDLDIAAIVGISARNSLVAEYHTATLDASDIIVLQQLSTVSLTLTVDDLGGVTGLSPTVRVRDTPTNNRWLDWSDGTFKTSGWILLDAPMTEIGRGHYHRFLDVGSLVGLSGGDFVAEYSADGGIEASERFDTIHDVSATPDATPPQITDVDPPIGDAVAPTGAVEFRVSDNVGLVAVFVYSLVPGADNSDAHEVVHDNATFLSPYLSSTLDATSGRLYRVRRTGGWPGPPRLRVIGYDAAGNEVEIA